MTEKLAVIFSHPEVNARFRKRGGKNTLISDRGRLVVPTGVNGINWGYGMNTISYSTFGGEVTQVLSTYITDLNIGGDVPNYAALEDIYMWFATYMAVATQGAADAGLIGKGRYNEDPVIMWYPQRQWQFKIKPMSLPGFKLGRDVVAPTWQMQAAIVEADPEAEAWTLVGASDGLDRINIGIGYRQKNPFSAPNNRAFSYGSVAGELEEISETYGELEEAWSSGNMSYFQPHFSGPPSTSKKNQQDK